MKVPSWKMAVIAVCFCAFGVFARSITFPMGFGDAETYMAMAEDPTIFAGSPWGYRVAVPYAARLFSELIGCSLQASFAVLQLGFFTAFLVGLWLWLRRGFRFDRFVAGSGCALFIVSYPGLYNLHNVVHVGLAEHLLVLLACMMLTGGRFLALVVVVGLSTVVKESVGLLIVPVACAYMLAIHDRGSVVLKTAVLGAVFLIPSIAIRSGWLLFRETSLESYASFYDPEYLAGVVGYWGGFQGALRETIIVYGPILVLAGFGFAFSSRRLKILVLLPVLAAVQIVLATDVARMIGVGFPVLCLYSAVLLERVGREWAVVLTAIPCLHFICINHGIQALHSLAGFTLIMLVVLWLRRNHLNSVFDAPVDVE
jgi:hypothetical protein